MNKQQRPTMTDEQIEQALTICSTGKNVFCCLNCPYRASAACMSFLTKDALAYIKRLKEGIPSAQEPEQEEQGRKCYCTNEVPETDCEGCNFVLTCTNSYGLSENNSPREIKDNEGNVVGYVVKCEHSPNGECCSYIDFDSAREESYTYCDIHGHCRFGYHSEE